MLYLFNLDIALYRDKWILLENIENYIINHNEFIKLNHFYI